jgi:branched-subunit amino acid transport protein
MDQTLVFLTILGMVVVTYLPRVLPVWWLSSRALPPLMVAWLRYVPVAVLAALLLPGLVIRDNHFTMGFENIFFWAAFPTLLVAWKTRSFFGSIFVGMAVVAAARFFSGG